VAKDQLIELCIPNLDETAVSQVQMLFDMWGRGGAVVERIGDEETAPYQSVKTYLRPEETEALQQIEIGLALIEKLRKTRGHPSLPGLQKKVLAEADWAESWKEGYHVLNLGRHIVVKPSWRDYTPHPDDVVIELDPGMAFGSGLHPTTQLCLVAIEDMLKPGMQVLDVGTGSGILAIAAAKLGASAVLAVDNDPMAAQVAEQNVIHNNARSVVSVAEGTLDKEPITDRDGVRGGWAMIVANILANPLIEMAPAFFANLAPEGILILSGINREQMERVTSNMENSQLSLIGSSLDGDWAALFFKK
jgi:ribosomal protein L11 methyltransferase